MSSSWEAGIVAIAVLLGIAVVSALIYLCYRRHAKGGQAKTGFSTEPPENDGAIQVESFHSMAQASPALEGAPRLREGESKGAEESLSLLARPSCVHPPSDSRPSVRNTALPLVPNRYKEPETASSFLPWHFRFPYNTDETWTHAVQELPEIENNTSTMRRSWVGHLRKFSNILQNSLHRPDVLPSYIARSDHTPYKQQVAFHRQDSLAPMPVEGMHVHSSNLQTWEDLELTQGEISFPFFASPVADSPPGSWLPKVSHDLTFPIPASPNHSSVSASHTSSPEPQSPIPHIRSVLDFHPGIQTQEPYSVTAAETERGGRKLRASSVAAEYHYTEAARYPIGLNNPGSQTVPKVTSIIMQG